jgi:hypothetical protein
MEAVDRANERPDLVAHGRALVYDSYNTYT